MGLFSWRKKSKPTYDLTAVLCSHPASDEVLNLYEADQRWVVYSKADDMNGSGTIYRWRDARGEVWARSQISYPQSSGYNSDCEYHVTEHWQDPQGREARRSYTMPVDYNGRVISTFDVPVVDALPLCMNFVAPQGRCGLVKSHKGECCTVDSPECEI